jgi:DNA-binding MarR family transcriptional regulator
VTAGPLNVLVIISKSGSLAPGEIARQLNMKKLTASRNLARMRENGWVAISTRGAGRQQRLILKEQGKALLQLSASVGSGSIASQGDAWAAQCRLHSQYRQYGLGRIE